MIESTIKTNNPLSTASNIIAFWNTRANPITMLPPSISMVIKKSQLEILRRDEVSFDEEYISLKEARKTLKLGVPTIKDYVFSLGETMKKHQSALYFKRELIPEIQKILSTITISESEDINNYISNPELMEMFHISPHKAWEISRKHKLVKKKFNRNIAYYEREKAIEIFSKYQKN